MVFHFHIENSFNKNVVNNHKIIQLNPALGEVNSEISKIPSKIHLSINTSSFHPNPQVSLDHNVENRLNKGVE